MKCNHCNREFGEKDICQNCGAPPSSDYLEIKNKLIALQNHYDTEFAHGEADDLLCELLVSLGYKTIVEEYNKIDKWYA